MGAKGCPTPAKKGYKNRATAKRHMWSLLTKRGGAKSWATLHVYRCGCGMYHVGHSRKKVT